jgi:hypothetical protein
MKAPKKRVHVSLFWPSTQESAQQIRELWSRLELKAVSNIRRASSTSTHTDNEEVEAVVD